MSPTGRRCHKHHNRATSVSLVAARAVAENVAGARRLHFSAQVSTPIGGDTRPRDSYE